MELSPEVAAGLIAALTATATSLVVLWMNQRFQKKQLAAQQELDRIDKQIGEFHGPMAALSLAARRLWETMAEEMNRNPASLSEFMRSDYHGNECAPSVRQLQDWKRWIKEIFRHLDEAREQIVLTKYDLASRDDVDPTTHLSNLVVHVAGFREVIKSWEGQESDEATALAWDRLGPRAFTPSNDFPKEAFDYLLASYDGLKEKRKKVLSSLRS